MGFKDMFKGKCVLIKVVDTIPQWTNFYYQISGRIEEETDEFLVVSDAIIGDIENYSLHKAKEVLINKDFVVNIRESKKNDVENMILRSYHKNRISWLIGFIFFDLGIVMGIILSSIYRYFFI